MPTRIKFVGVPKTFTTRTAALKFLSNSPGYVSRQSSYLQTNWPGLYAEIAPKKPNLRARGPQAPLAAGSGFGGKVVAGVGRTAVKAASDVADYGADAVRGGKRVVAPSGRKDTARITRKMIEPGKTTPGTVGRNFEVIGDDVIGKGLTNLAQGQGPKNWKDVAGLGIGAAGVFPIGRGGRVLGAGIKAGLEAQDVAAGAAKVARATPEPLGPKTLPETVQEAFSGAPESIAEQARIYSQERAIRSQGAMKAYYDANGGTAGKNAALGELKGAMPVIEWNGAKKELNPETVDQMTRHIFEESDLRFYEKVRAVEGIERAVSGQAPQKSQLMLINHVFGKNTADTFGDLENHKFWKGLYDAGLKIWNIPRSMMASFDLSAPFRQGLVAGARHPVLFSKNIKPMIKSFGSEKVTKALMDDVVERENFSRYGQAKLAIQDVQGTGALREEQFPGSYVDNVPGIKNSARAYTAYLNKMRADVFDVMIDAAQANGKNIDDPQFLKALGEYINTSTGRGKIPGGDAGENAATFLNAFLFSPRLLASRLQILNPGYYIKLWNQDPFVAQQALRASGQTIAGIFTMLTLGSQISGASVGLNPLSADFGKIRIGDTRVDVMGGFQPLLVLAARMKAKKSVSSSSGKTQDLKGGFGQSDRWDIMLRFLEGKMAPTPGMIRDAMRGQTFIGEPITAKGMATGMIPLNVQGAQDVYKTEGSLPAAAAGLGLGSIGFGVGSYPDVVAAATKSSSGGRSSSRPRKSSSSSRSSSRPRSSSRSG